MNERLYEASGQLADEERKRNVGAFFGSIHGTLNHSLWPIGFGWPVHRFRFYRLRFYRLRFYPLRFYRLRFYRFPTRRQSVR